MLLSKELTMDSREGILIHQNVPFEKVISGNFVRLIEDLERSYFNEVRAALKKLDSLSVSRNFKKLPHSLSRQYEKETKKLIKKLYCFNGRTSSTSDYLIEPRYTIRIEQPNPIAYTLSLEYVLIDKLENKIYKITF